MTEQLNNNNMKKYLPTSITLMKRPLLPKSYPLYLFWASMNT